MSAADWNRALRTLAIALPDDAASIMVIDEVPWLVEQDSEFEGALQTVWDRHLSAKPVLLVLVGSDVSVMEALQSHGRPFFGRATKMTVAPLLVAGELSLLGEFPEASRSWAVLEAIGSGERTFGTIAAAAGSVGALPAGTLTPLLSTLQAKRIVAADLPLSTKPDSKNKRYRIADSYLRFWLAFLERGIPLIERGRGDLALERIERSWTTWRGRAVEPVVRESLLRLLPDERWPGTEAVGGWWNRQNNPEIDLIGADREPVAGAVHEEPVRMSANALVRLLEGYGELGGRGCSFRGNGRSGRSAGLPDGM
ncbi:ATP-binding protein [Nocardia otitidiscaviarum]|uniref:ATP-binding protein n=1 Tax=Nocardia otitidiscaviarum TaxID=1823 RepID=UPI001E46346E|nr:DUF234 domain-containing protein [Nocardia otitidiscaviarum]